MKNIVMTEGSIGKNMFLFAVPMLLHSILQQLLSTVDMFFIGNYIGRNAAAAVGASGLLITCMIGLFTGISTGLGVLAARLFGSKQIKALKKAISIGVLLGVVFGILVTIIGFLYMEEILLQFRIPQEIQKDALIYARIYVLGMIPMVLFHIYAAALKATGEAKMPVYSLFIGGIFHVFLDFLFIVTFGFGIQGAAIATTLTQWLVAVFTRYQYHRYSKKRLKEYEQETEVVTQSKGFYIKEIIRVGLPAGLQAILLTMSNLIMQYYVNHLGTGEIAAFSAYFKIETFIYLPILAMGQTILIFVSQNGGAKKTKRVYQGIWYGLGMGILLTIFLSMALLLLGEKSFLLLIKDNSVARYGVQIIFVTFPFYFLYAILDITANAIRGLGNSLVPMFHSIFSLCVLRTALVILYFSRYEALRGFVFIYPITWFVCALLNAVYLYQVCKKLRIKEER